MNRSTSYEIKYMNGLGFFSSISMGYCFFQTIFCVAKYLIKYSVVYFFSSMSTIVNTIKMFGLEEPNWVIQETSILTIS